MINLRSGRSCSVVAVETDNLTSSVSGLVVYQRVCIVNSFFVFSWLSAVLVPRVV
jgi:hypothetical protein